MLLGFAAVFAGVVVAVVVACQAGIFRSATEGDPDVPFRLMQAIVEAPTSQDRVAAIEAFQRWIDGQDKSVWYYQITTTSSELALLNVEGITVSNAHPGAIDCFDYREMNEPEARWRESGSKWVGFEIQRDDYGDYKADTPFIRHMTRRDNTWHDRIRRVLAPILGPRRALPIISIDFQVRDEAELDAVKRLDIPGSFYLHGESTPPFFHEETRSSEPRVRLDWYEF